MTLTLAIEGAGRLDNGAPGALTLDRRGAVVGRAPTCDWPLPDPTRHLSSRHFEVRFDGTGYTLVDCSTNGTVLVASGQRITGAHPIADGDRFQVGPYVIAARLSGGASRTALPDTSSAWQSWDAAPIALTPTPDPSGWGAVSGDASAPALSSGWDAPAVRPDTGDRWLPRLGPSLARDDPHRAGAVRHGEAATAPAAWTPSGGMAPPPTPSTWDQAQAAPEPASNWSSAAPDRPGAAAPDDLWGRIAEGNVVDWARGGFGQPVEPPRDPLGLSPAASALPTERPTPPSPASMPIPPAAAPDGGFAVAVGLDAAQLGDPAVVIAKAGTLLRRLVAGLVVMMEARARAKSQLGAEATAFSQGGHNPLKFARTPEEALAMLLGSSPPGFMPAEQAVEDAFRDLQSHQVATLRAMQGALRATLDRFSPTAIRSRADAGGMIERIVPAARDAALWQAYTREFGGVVQGSDEAFLDIFAKEFRNAYNDQVRRPC